MSHQSANRYPLTWPEGWPRTKNRLPARFGQYRQGGGTTPVSVATAVDRLQSELDKLPAVQIVLSTNIELRLDGTPYSNRPEPADPGAALYFRIFRADTVLASDKWTRVADNIAAIAAHIGALRGIDRWGVGSLEQAFRGYAALPPPTTMGWRDVLGPCATLEEAEARYRNEIKGVHPDIPDTGNHARAVQLNAAITMARGEFAG